MLAKRIIPCLDVKQGQVVKGVQFKNHQVLGNSVEFAKQYSAAGADELVFYDITASSEQRTVNTQWIREVASQINIPFCVAGGIRSLKDAAEILAAGADKISINSPALEQPDLIDALVKEFGQQCVVIGIDSMQQDDTYIVYQYTGNSTTTRNSGRHTLAWVKEIQERGAGECVLNCMNQDGVRQGYDITQLQKVREITHIPLIASGGAGEQAHFLTVFNECQVDGALAASVFHSGQLRPDHLKTYLAQHQIEVRT